MVALKKTTEQNINFQDNYKFVKPFNEIRKSDISVAGGKGASLGEMINTGIPVPDGFVVLSEAFTYFIDTTSLSSKIGYIFGRINPKRSRSIEAASKKIMSAILNENIPLEIADSIMSSFFKLKTGYVAVRSSATAEDSSVAAWAGQLESYLNTTKDTLLDNIKRCWASLFTPRAIFYRFENNMQKENISVAVVVQKMVDSEKSGIAFTVHPVTKDKNQMVIEAGFGLGESVVGGLITPDSYVLKKNSFSIVDVTVSKQDKMIVRSAKGSTKTRSVPSEIRNLQKLDKGEIMSLAKICKRIESHYGYPCDIEWAIEKGKIYILQSRPITTLMDNVVRNIKTTIPKRIFTKIFNRYMPIYAAQYSYIGKGEGVLGILKNAASFPPIYVNKPGRGASVYYELKEYEMNSRRAIEFFRKNRNAMKKICDEYKKIYYKNIKLIENADIKDIKKLFDINAYYITPLITILILVGREEYDEDLKDVVEIAKETRYWNDKILYITGEKIFNLISKKFGLSPHNDIVDYITIEEALNDKLPNMGVIARRRKSWVMIDNNTIYTGKNIKGFLSKHDIVLEDEDISFDRKTRKLIGRSAYNGVVQGKVKLVFVYDDIFKVKEGDIMVSPMTEPHFMPAIKKASALITDEGGITCHAAIIARELGIPCVIGTKLATEVLNDGDFVEVDADNGLVKIIRRAK